MDCHSPRDFQIYNQRKYPTDNETSDMTRISHSFALQIFVLQKYEMLLQVRPKVNIAQGCELSDLIYA